MDIRNIIQKYQERKYWEKREAKWKNFRKSHKSLECGLVNPCLEYGYKPHLWEYDCIQDCYKEEFFAKYGCMYIKDFMNY